MRCDNCKFWKWNALQVNSEHDVQAGRCHRFPPSYIGEDEYDFDGDQTFKWANPETNRDDWCGEFIEAPNVGVKRS